MSAKRHRSALLYESEVKEYCRIQIERWQQNQSKSND